MKYLCDTNIVYHKPNKEKLKKLTGEDRPNLIMAPISILELLTTNLCGYKKFRHIKDSVIWILNNNVHILPAWEKVMADRLCIGLNINDPWQETFQQLLSIYASSNSISQLRKKIISKIHISICGIFEPLGLKEGDTRRLDYDSLIEWRRFLYDAYYQETQRAINYTTQKICGKAAYPTSRWQPDKRERSNILNYLESEDLFESMCIVNLYDVWHSIYVTKKYENAANINKNDCEIIYLKQFAKNSMNSQCEYIKHNNLLRIYWTAYIHYLKEVTCLNFRLKNGNDMGDSDILHYLDLIPNTRLVTAESSNKHGGKIGWGTRITSIPEISDFVIIYR